MKHSISLASASSCLSSPTFVPPSFPLPTALRRAIEWLSGYDMREVRVFYDSPLPQQYGASAFAYGSAIHLGPGAQAALAHEAWHVVQQKQGRSRVTVVLGDTAGNDDRALEDEADWMGALACCLSRFVRILWPRSSLRQQTILSPLMQRAVTINGTKFTGEESSFLKLSRYVTDALYKNLREQTTILFPSDLMSEILVDFVNEDLVFNSDAEALAEVAIRKVGYRAESAMRSLMNQNAPLVGKKLHEMETSIKAVEAQWKADATIERDKRVYKSEAEVQSAIYDIKKNADESFLKWQPASYLNKPMNSPMMNWMLGKTTTEPLAMNCWEATLYSLVKSGAVTKDYINWANTTLKVAPNCFPITFTAPVTQFLLAAVRNRDKFWTVPSSDSLVVKTDCAPQKFKWEDTKMVCIDENVIIPRGRLVICNFASHVAISTGRKFRIASEEARRYFNMQMGHGILELDKPDTNSESLRTISETTLEDLYIMGSTYLQHIMIAPFPMITEDGATVIKPPFDPGPSIEKKIQEVYDGFSQKQIDKEIKSLIEGAEKEIKKHNIQMEKFAIGSTDYNVWAAKISRCEQTIANAQTTIENKYRTLAKNSNQVKKVEQAAKDAKKSRTPPQTDPLVFPYTAVDPYHGLVVMPNKS